VDSIDNRPLDLLNENISIEAAFKLSSESQEAVRFLKQDRVIAKTLGRKYLATKQIDVYVDANSIEKPFKKIGTGFIGLVFSAERMQKKAEKKAKAIGADALLIEYYSVVDERTLVSSTQMTIDTATRIPQGVITTQTGSLTRSGFNISFLKYAKK